MWMKFLFMLGFAHATSSELSGDHVCPQEERYLVNVTRYVSRNITVRTYKWCLQVPPRCSTYIVKTINDSRIEEEERVRLVNKCCEGFREDFHENCIPLTCFNCTNGKCIDDEWCDCETGYEGPTCEDACDSNHWGKSCRNLCECERGVCDPLTGECVCPPRWNGSRCEVCAEGHAGEQCNCNCNETAACDLVTSKCTSASGGNESETSGAIENYETDDFFPPENYRSVYQEPVLQKYHTFDLEYATTTKIPKNYFTTRARKKSTSLPYSYFKSTAIPKGPILEKFFFATEIGAVMDSTYLSNDFNNAEGDSPEISTWDYDEHKQELTPVNTEIQRPASIMQHEQKAKAFQMNVSSADAGHVREERFLDDARLPQEPLFKSGLVYSAVSAALVTLTILLLAGGFLACFKLRRKVVMIEEGNTERQVSSKIAEVSLTTNSIFHTPLPDPPLFENPLFSTPLERINRIGTTFETRVVCSMNFPHHASCVHDTPEFFYDHPPSTGSYRAASLPEPPDLENERSRLDPIYDEIPCCKKLTAITSSPPPHAISDGGLYMNTSQIAV